MQMRLQARDVACTVAAELLLGPFTQLQVDLSVAPLQQPDGVPALVLARQNGHLSWTSILTAQASICQSPCLLRTAGVMPI